jgi:5-methylcytosine-specific restriction enzyme subunit McrC
MGAASVGLPTIVVSGGPMLNGKYKGRDIGSGTDVWKFSEDVRSGKMSLEEFYERLANILALRILDRLRRGLYRTYVPHARTLPYLRGRVGLMRAIQQPWNVDLHCRFRSHTADVDDNQIPAFTLLCIARSGACSERVLPNVRKAFRAIQSMANPRHFAPTACSGRTYNRLNDDYQPLHALCRFFLEHTGPSHEHGERRMLPFLIDMSRLFELFVAEWLEAHIPDGLMLQQQERLVISEKDDLSWRVDLVLRHPATGEALAVLDTKYKKPGAPSPDDVAQVVAYAEATDAPQAVLIYPSEAGAGISTQVGKIQFSSLAFRLDDDIESAGERFLSSVLRMIGGTSRNTPVRLP